eukprot:1624522-Pyramimonas_sp.AAC.1
MPSDTERADAIQAAMKDSSPEAKATTMAKNLGVDFTLGDGAVKTAARKRHIKAVEQARPGGWLEPDA